MGELGAILDIGEDVEGDLGSIEGEAGSLEGDAEDLEGAEGGEEGGGGAVAVQGPRIVCNVKAFYRFGRDCKAAARDLERAVREELLRAGHEIAAEARDNVAGYSSKVAASIRVRPQGTRVVIEAGGPGVPMAGLLELGNAGRNGGGVFRHPVYGNRQVWANQKMHPYLVPAMRGDAFDRAMQRALDRAVARIAR